MHEIRSLIHPTIHPLQNKYIYGWNFNLKAQAPNITNLLAITEFHNSLFQNEAKYKTFAVKMSFICIRINK